MSDNNERAFVASLYPGPRWKKKVGKMPSAQVHAIYMREMEKKHQAKKQKREQTPREESTDDGIPF